MGDTNYDKFCHVGKLLDRRLHELGGDRIHPITCCDEATANMVEEVEAWKQVALPFLSETTLSETSLSAAPSSSAALLILYGSETGNCESISKDIYEAVQGSGVACKWGTLNEYKKLGLLEPCDRTVLIVTSTTGNGDAPNNAERFYRFIRKRTNANDLLSHVSFGLLALGDTNYDQFCKVGKFIDKRMEQLGAQRMLPLLCADEATGLEDVVEPWKLKAIQAVTNHTPSKPMPSTPSPRSTVVCDQDRIGWSPPAEILQYKDLFSGKTVDDLHAQIRTGRTPRSAPCLAKVSFVGSEELDLRARTTKRSNVEEYGTTPSFPLIARVVSAKYLSSNISPKRVVCATLEMSNDSCPLPEWQPGDAAGIICPNPAVLVEDVIRKLGFSRDKRIKVVRMAQGKPVPVLMFPELGVNTIWEILTWGVDLTSLPRKQFLKVLSEFCAEEMDKWWLELLSSTAGTTEYKVLIEQQRPSLFELLQMFPSCDPPLDALLYHLPSLAPRLYSIANTPLTEHGHRCIRIAFTVVRREIVNPKCKRIVSGICTSWLESVCEPWLTRTSTVTSPIQGSSLPIGKDKELRVFIKPSSGFRLPARTEEPLLMVGPGTGVAPFIGFLEHLSRLSARYGEKQIEMLDGFWRGGMNPMSGEFVCEEEEVDGVEAANGKVVLYFGCRHPKHDLLFKDEIQDFIESQVLSSFECAFSRYREEDRGPKYVYELLKNNGKDVFNQLVNQAGYLCVCGSLQMGNAVHDAILEIIIHHGNKTREEAIEFTKQMLLRGKYMKDIWG